MDSSDRPYGEDLESFLAHLEASPELDSSWEDSSDLGRLHLQAFARAQNGGFELAKSRGAIRLTGDGVRGHSLDLADAGQVLGEFQNLVTVTGAALQGQTNTRGRLRGDVIRRTKLALSASPSEGSVILEFEPATEEAEERYPGGVTTVDGVPQPLVEESVEKALEVLGVAASSAVDREGIHRLFEELGPRVAAASRALASTAAAARLDLNVSWERPGSMRKRVKATASECATFASVLQGEGLIGEVVSLRGVLRTISDRKKIDLETTDPDDGEVAVIAIDRGEVDLMPFHLGDLVEMSVSVEVIQRPGGSESRKYTAIYLSPIAGVE